MVRWRTVCPAALLIMGLATTPAEARNLGVGDIAFDGVARTGTDTRPVRFRFLCSSNDGPNLTGVLSVDLTVPRFEELGAVFDFIPFEGPDANAGALTILQATGVRTRANNRFAASGSIQGTGAPYSFELDVTASRRAPAALRRLAAVLRPLLDGPAQLIWRQGNAKPGGNVKPGGTPMLTSLELTRERADQLKVALGPCLR